MLAVRDRLGSVYLRDHGSIDLRENLDWLNEILNYVLCYESGTLFFHHHMYVWSSPHPKKIAIERTFQG